MKKYMVAGIAFLVSVCTFSVGFYMGKTQEQKISQSEIAVLKIHHQESLEAAVKEAEALAAEKIEAEKENEIVEKTESEKRDPFTEEEKAQIVLVNKNNKLPEDYKVSLKQLPDRTNFADMKAYDAMCSMLKDARKEGLVLEVCSSYRSVERQKELFEEDMRALVRKGYSYLDAYDEVAKETMPPGYSEHSTGLAFDIVALSYQMLNEKQEKTEENKWLQEHCAEYGFILRYPKGKEEITGISYESWHFRYVGTEMAKYIMENGLTLEEFLAGE